jgi:hypothetical protein
MINQEVHYKNMYQGSTDNYQRLFSEHTKNDTNSKSQIRDLEARLDKLELVCESLWKIIKETTNLNETDLIERMSNIDLQDGRFDGKKRKISSFECSKCGRINSKRHSKCMYCSEVHLLDPFE